ncbi:hypothetical protein D3C72_1625720 [compost metagenome]
MPATLVCGTKSAELSTSLASRLPPVLWAALVSVRLAVLEPVMTAASLLPAKETCAVAQLRVPFPRRIE